MRRFPLRFGLALAGISFLSLVVAVSVAIGDDDPAVKPVAGIANVMNALNHEQHGLFGMIKTFCDQGGTKDAEVWKLMRHRAQILAEAGNILMTKSPPRGADDEAGMKKWKQHCATYRKLNKDLAKALAFKKVAKVKTAIDKITAQCEACHKDHKSN